MHLEAVVELFVAKDKRERIRFLAGKPSRRGDLRQALLHDTRSLDRATLTPIATADANPASVVRLMGAKPTAATYCISALDELDERDVALGDALTIAIGRQEDTLIYCPATRRAYLETHEGDRYLLSRR